MRSLRVKCFLMKDGLRFSCSGHQLLASDKAETLYRGQLTYQLG